MKKYDLWAICLIVSAMLLFVVHAHNHLNNIENKLDRIEKHKCVCVASECLPPMIHEMTPEIEKRLEAQK